ncbi:MAG: (2Fe-2S)-binding protein [Rhodobacteraceae bacterium]|nr:(2Fe-2S)-binding protein [Paracoccaceae bacterium]
MNVSKNKSSNTAVFLRSARIISGIFLLLFIATHLLNMILGLHSITLVDGMRPYLSGIWTGPVGSKILLAVLFTHFLLALQAIYKRETLRMSANDMVQFLAGLLIIPLLIPHAIGIGAMKEISTEASYGELLRFFWLHDPIAGLRQVLLVAIVWVHGCIGLLIWMRSKMWSVRVLPWFYPLAVAVPVLALLGYVSAGRDILLAASQAEKSAHATEYPQGYDETAPYKGYSLDRAKEHPETTEPEVDAGQIVAQSKIVTSRIIWITSAMVLLTLLARLLRVSRHRKKFLEIDYIRGPIIKARSGPNMLDIARHADLPHANICHGRGRCGTCRVLVLSSSEDLPAPSELEQKTLNRLGCGPGVRLACQLSPPGGIMRVERMLPADYTLKQDLPVDVAEQEAL